MVNIDIGSRHFDLKFCHGRTTGGHDGGLDVLQWRCNQGTLRVDSVKYLADDVPICGQVGLM